MENLQYHEVSAQKDIEALASLAEHIWREHFTPIIGADQVTYMLEKFQSAEAVSRQLSQEGYQYLLLRLEGADIGYTGFRPEGGCLFLSKLYIDKAYRGNRYASQVIAYLTDFCQEKNLDYIWLTVNKNNDNTIAIYKKLGFDTVREQRTDIGGGFYMDDYVMQRKIN